MSNAENLIAQIAELVKSSSQLVANDDKRAAILRGVEQMLTTIDPNDIQLRSIVHFAAAQITLDYGRAPNALLVQSRN